MCTYIATYILIRIIASIPIAIYYSAIKPQPIMLNFLPITCAFEQCSKILPIVLNIMPMTTAIMPQFVCVFMTSLA